MAIELSQTLLLPLSAVVSGVAVCMMMVASQRDKSILGEAWRDAVIYGIVGLFDFLAFLNMVFTYLSTGVIIPPI